MTTAATLIPLTKGYSAIVDADDYDWLMQWKWSAVLKGRCVYAVRGKSELSKAYTVYMHRELLPAPSGMLVDHININGLDNRRANLRLCTRGENNRNSRSRVGASSDYLGVCWDTHRAKWKAYISVDGRLNNIGRYDTEIEAARAYDKAARELFGEFANPNFEVAG